MINLGMKERGLGRDNRKSESQIHKSLWRELSTLEKSCVGSGLTCNSQKRKTQSISNFLRDLQVETMSNADSSVLDIVDLRYSGCFQSLKSEAREDVTFMVRLLVSSLKELQSELKGQLSKLRNENKQSVATLQKYIIELGHNYEREIEQKDKMIIDLQAQLAQSGRIFPHKAQRSEVVKDYLQQIDQMVANLNETTNKLKKEITVGYQTGEQSILDAIESVQSDSHHNVTQLESSLFHMISEKSREHLNIKQQDGKFMKNQENTSFSHTSTNFRSPTSSLTKKFERKGQPYFQGSSRKKGTLHLHPEEDGICYLKEKNPIAMQANSPANITLSHLPITLKGSGRLHLRSQSELNCQQKPSNCAFKSKRDKITCQR